MERDTRGALWASSLPPRLYAKRFAPSRALVEGRGRRVRDVAGRWYLDARASLWDATLGYGHGGVAEALREQLERLPVCQTIRHDRPSEMALRFADAVAARLPAGLTRIRFGNTGSQMVDAAVLLSRMARSLSGEAGRLAVLATEDGYHGTGSGPSALTEPEVVRQRFGALLPGVHQVRLDGHASWPRVLMARADEIGHARVTAIVIEPILGSEIQEIAADEMRALARYCGQTGIHLVVDEVATGWGRAGAWTVCGEAGIEPDLLVLGKGLTAGYVPGAALAVSERLFARFDDPVDGAAFAHGSTSDGHPLAMAAGLAVIEALESGVLARVPRLGRRLRERLAALENPPVVEVRGRGLLLGAWLGLDARRPWSPHQMERLRAALERRGVLAHPVGPCLTIAPPLTIEPDECDEIADALRAAIGDVS